MKRLVPAAVLLALLFAGSDALPARLIGEAIPFSGVVQTPGGEPLPGMTVVLELTRESFRLLRMKRETSVPVRMVARTDEEGRWTLDWAWDGHYNRFSIVWGLPSPDPEKDVAVLDRRDVTDTVDAGQPVVADLTLEAGPWADWVVGYLSGHASGDERQVFGQMGAPDRVEILSAPEGKENTWFYFAAGRAYRFGDGRLLGVESFEPVASPSP